MGKLNNPQGNLFACDIVCQGTVAAGTLGAVSGSTLKIDFSPGFSKLLERKDTMDELLEQLRQNSARHKEKIALIKAKMLPAELKQKMNSAVELYKNEAALLNWLELKTLEMRKEKENYMQAIGLDANKRIYNGVSVKLNNRSWRSEREYDRSTVRYDSHQWLFDPKKS